MAKADIEDIKQKVRGKVPPLTIERLRTKLEGRSRSSIYRDIEAGRLPKPMKRGGRVYWLEEEVDAALIRLRGDSSASD